MDVDFVILRRDDGLLARFSVRNDHVLLLLSSNSYSMETFSFKPMNVVTVLYSIFLPTQLNGCLNNKLRRMS